MSVSRLIDIDASRIKAVYDPFTGILELLAKGEEPPFWLQPFFQREKLFGALLFSLRAIPTLGPEGKYPNEPFETTYKLPINLPEPHFDSKYVLVETAKGTWPITIEYLGFGPANGDKPATLDGTDIADAQKGNDINAGQQFSDVLPPIDKFLLNTGRLNIHARIPQEVGLGKVWVEAHFNHTYFKLVNAAYEADNIVWTFEWAKAPTGKGENPQLIDITTTQFNGLFGASAITSKIIQGYIVTYVLPLDSE